MASSKKDIKDLRKKYSQEIKKSAKEKGWKTKDSFLYKVENDFYLDTSYHIHSLDKMFGTIRLKPLFLDEVFWKIIGSNSLLDEPLSLRSTGWSAAKAIYFHFYEIQLTDDINKDIQQFYSMVDSKMAEIREKYRNIDDYIATLKLDLETNKFYVVNLITTFVFLNDTENINALIRQCRYNKIDPGISSDGKNFYDMVEDYMKTIKDAPQQ